MKHLVLSSAPPYIYAWKTFADVLHDTLQVWFTEEKLYPNHVRNIGHESQKGFVGVSPRVK